MTLPPLLLPNRPLTLKHDVISTPRAYFWSTPLLLALAVFMFVWEAPGVVRDFRISQNPLVLATGEVRDGQCTTRRAIFTDCEARLVYSYDGKDYETDVNVMFVDFHTGDYETGLVISADHPELATISLGLDMLWNRIITLTAFVLFFAGLGLGMIFMALRIWRTKRQLRRPAILSPIPVEITAFDRKRGVLSITYHDKIAANKTGRSAYTRMMNGQEPLIVGEVKGKSIGLAVRHGNAALPVLVDNRLERIDLTDEERAAALAPLIADQQASGSQQGPVLVEEQRKGMSIWKRLKLFFGTLLLIAVGIFGFWFWYVTSSGTQFQSPGMDINNMMPKPLNAWGCDQLKKRFGHERVPFGCVADDYVSWK